MQIDPSPSSRDDTTPQNDRSNDAWSASWACVNGHWTRRGNVAVPIDDLGLRMGVIAVERLRTRGGTVWQVRQHGRRFAATCEFVGIAPVEANGFCDGIDELVRRNLGLAELVGDFGITVLATPGGPGGPGYRASHVNALDHDLIRRRLDAGSSLVVTDVRQPSPECWPRALKIRSRVHYLLADRAARQIVDKEGQIDPIGLLIDDDGSVTETGIANVAIVEDGCIVSPPRDRVLAGVTQSVVEGVAAEANIGWSFQAIAPERLRAADEVLLMGTDTGLWFASDVDGQPKSARSIYGRLRREFDRLITDRNGSA